MNYLKNVLYFLLGCFVWSCQATAGNDPIAWTLNRTFPATVYTGINYTITYTFTNKLPMRLAKPLQIQKNASSTSEFSYTDNCSGNRLRSNQSCTVQIRLNPFVAGEKYIQVSIAGYSRDVVPLPQIITIANSGQAAGVLGAVSDALPNTMNAGSSASYAFTFTNYGNVDATDVTTTVTQTTGTVNTTQVCSGTLAKNGGTCTVQGSFLPSSSTPATQSVRASLNFSGASGSPSSVSTTTTLNTPDALIVGSIIVPYSLPPLMEGNGPGASIKFLFSNVSGSLVTLTDQGTIICTASDASNCSGAFTPPVSQCINGNLGASQNCEISTTFNPPAANTPPVTYTLTATLGYVGLGNPASVATSGTVVGALPTQRTIQIVNNCGFTLSYSLHGAALPASAPTNPCPPGSTLKNGSCWWINHVGTSNILLTGSSDYVTIPADSYLGTQWSGVISASIGCSQPLGGGCTQSTCDNSGGTTSCEPSKGFHQPATQAEITMLISGDDTYDVEVINGFHIPISMKPYLVIDQVTPANSVPASADGYTCGTPGNNIASNGFGACNWATAAPPTPTKYYYLVGGGSGANCSASACATPGELCGLSQPDGIGTITGPKCGNFQGFWTPNQLCTQANSNLPASVAAALQCNTSTGYNLNPPDSFNNTYTSLMACPVATGYTGPTYNSCYTTTYPSGSDVDQCCGCVNWWDPTKTNGVAIGANNTATTCPAGQINPLWVSVVQSGIQWLKKACPSVYVYPFDDATSKFTCTNNTQSGTNTTSYVITLCAGNSGLPAGKTEGRG